jgi:hypothetical protein
MKRLYIILIFIAILALPCIATISPSIENKHTWDNSYRFTDKPKDLFLDWCLAIENAVDGTTGLPFLYCIPDDTADQSSEGTIYYDSDTDNLYYRNASAWVAIATSTSGTMAETYAQGSGITVDTDAITLTTTTAADNVALAIVHGETGNYSAMTITNASAYPAIQITGSSTGDDITGTSGLWTVSEAGVGTFAGLIVGATDIVLENGDKIENGTNDVILFNTGDEDLTIDFTTGANKLTLGSNSTGATEIATGDFVTLSGLTTITGTAADFTMSIAADAGGEDLIISQTGSVDGSVQIVSAGTGTDAIDIETSAGGISVASTGGDTVIDATDKSITIDSGEASADDAIVITTTGAGSGMQITSLADIDITTTGASGEDIAITNTGGSVAITATEAATDAIVLNASTALGGIDITSNEDIDITTTGAAGEDISITNTGGSVNITATEAITTALVIDVSTAGAGIDITSGEDIDISTTGAAGEDISITNTGGSINLSATESAVDSIVISSTVGGIDITAAGGAATEDIDITATSSSINLNAGENAAAAISLVTGAGATGGTSETIVMTNTDGTGEDAFNIDATAGGIDIDFATAKNMAITGGQFIVTSNEDVASAINLVTNTGSSETIVVTNTQGTAAGAIALTATAGGITLTAGADDAITLNSGTGDIVFSGDIIKNFIYEITADTDGENVSAAASGTVFTNAAAGGAQTFTLPTAAAGLTYTFIVMAEQELRIDPGADDVININGTAASAAEYWTANAIGESITLVAVDSVNWIATAYTGTWTQESP